MDEELYDEFGNYIGPELADSDASDESEEELSEGDQEDENASDGEGQEDMDTEQPQEPIEASDENQIVLHEDKNYYPDAQDVYGGAETVVLDEDAQPLEEPIIAPVKTKSFSTQEKKLPKTTYSMDFMTSLMETPTLIRNVAVVGHLHCGKTLLMDILISSTHEDEWKLEKETKYTDTRKDEQERELSIKSTPVSLVLEDTREKSYLVNLIDCPGHLDFSDEMSAGMRAADGVVLVVDAVEGVMAQTDRALKLAVDEGLPVVLVINKLDRLILELKLPPADAYYKLVHTLEEVNNLLAQHAAAAAAAAAPLLLLPHLPAHVLAGLLGLLEGGVQLARPLVAPQRVPQVLHALVGDSQVEVSMDELRLNSNGRLELIDGLSILAQVVQGVPQVVVGHHAVPVLVGGPAVSVHRPRQLALLAEDVPDHDVRVHVLRVELGRHLEVPQRRVDVPNLVLYVAKVIMTHQMVVFEINCFFVALAGFI